MSQNRATYRLSLEGRDLGLGAPTSISEILQRQFADRVGPRLISVSLAEKRGGEADQLDIVLHDHDGRLEIPTPGQVLALQLGWEVGSDVPIGLVDKGRFKVDEAEWSGPPDIVTIRARAADFAASFDRRRETSHVGRTLREILQSIADEQGLALQVAVELGALVIDVIEQDETSDAALLRTLGRQFDAAATVKNGTLVFASIGAGATAVGSAIPGLTITRGSGDSYSYRRAERGQFNGVEARWHDTASGERQTVEVEGSSDTDRPRRRLNRVYASETSARRAAESAQTSMERAAAEFEITLAHGRPDIYPGRQATVSGFKREIDAQSWLVAECTHELSGDSGLTTQLKFESIASS